MKQINFADDHITANVMRIAVPMLIAQTVNLLYSIVDRIFIARIPGSGTAALGAVGLCFPLIILVTAFTNLIGMGGSPLFAIELGKRNRDGARKIMCVSFTLIVLSAALIFAAFEIFAEPMLCLIGASEGQALAVSTTYLRIYLTGTFFQMTAIGMNPFINAQGFPDIGMRTVVIGAAANTVLDPVFIFGLGMGVRGAAIATVISQGLSSASALSFLLGKRSPLKLRLLRRDELAGSRREIVDILSLGSSAFVMQATNSLVSMCCNSVLSRIGGDIYISVMAIVASVRQLLDVPVLAFADGSSPMISFNYGAGNGGHVRKIIRTVSLIGISYTAVVWLLISLYPAFFISIFSGDASILAYAVPALHVYFFAFVFQALQYSGQTVFKALGKKKYAIFFSLFRKVIIVIPLTFLLPYAFGLGTTGVFAAEPVSNVIGGTACFLTMAAVVRRELA